MVPSYAERWDSPGSFAEIILWSTLFEREKGPGKY
jgi:hypothetical protein